jgi:nicotinate-nucleotide adenylyltransferase
MGSDGFQNLNKWKNYQTLVKNYSFYIYLRPGFKIEENSGASIHILQAPLLDISSTAIRNLIAAKKSIRFLVPDIVKEEIERNAYYRT